MVNKVILIGNLGKDPELTHTPNGAAVAKVTVATTEHWTDKQGNKQEQTEWHNLVFWNRSAEVVNEYLAKGSKIYVEGKLHYRSWEGQDGQKRYATDIVVKSFQFLSTRGSGSQDNHPAKNDQKPKQQSQQTHQPQGGQQDDGSFGSADDDDMPF